MEKIYSFWVEKFGSKANWILDVKCTEIWVEGKKEGAMQWKQVQM